MRNYKCVSHTYYTRGLQKDTLRKGLYNAHVLIQYIPLFPSKSEVIKVTSDELPISLETVTDTWKGEHTLGAGSEVMVRQKGPPVLYVAVKSLPIPVASVTATSKLSTGNSVCEKALKHRLPSLGL